MSEYYCYILKCSDGTFYTGWTTDPDRRVREHQAGRAARYTSRRLPVRLVYLEELESRSAAQKREYRIKRNGRKYKQRLIETFLGKTTIEESRAEYD